MQPAIIVFVSGLIKVNVELTILLMHSSSVSRSEAVIFFTLGSCLVGICFVWYLKNKPSLLYFNGHFAILVYFLLTFNFFFCSNKAILDSVLPFYTTCGSCFNFILTNCWGSFKLFFSTPWDSADCVWFLGCVW